MIDFQSLQASAWHVFTLSASVLSAIVILYVTGGVFYNLFLHPLRSYPGPLLWRATGLAYEYYDIKGVSTHAIDRFHRKYGPVVRLKPNMISFTSSQAAKDALGHTAGKPEFPKNPIRLPPNGVHNILGADKDTHARYRRLLAHAFSEKGLRDQEAHISHYVDLLVDRLEEKAREGVPTEMVSWYNMVTFDVIGDLAFGESFDSLQNRQLHDWIPFMTGNIRNNRITMLLKSRGLQFLSRYFVPDEIRASRQKNFGYATERVERRLAYGGDRGDFWDRIINKSADDNKAGHGMTADEMNSNASVLVLGGSETSATALSGTTYLLLKNPAAMQKIVSEIRSTFHSTEEITIFSVAHLKYTTAVLEETMRIYPPVPAQNYRRVPKNGAFVCGEHFPEETAILTPQYAAFHSEANFHRAHDFVPERWLDDAAEAGEFANDDKAAFLPFSLGTRNCIGRNLAYAEMRLILTKLLWHFDLELDAAKENDWLDQKCWALWQKKPLWVKLTAVER